MKDKKSRGKPVLKDILEQIKQIKKYEEIEKYTSIMIFTGLYLHGIGERIPERYEN